MSLEKSKTFLLEVSFVTDSPPHLPAAAQMDISLFSTCLPLQLCMLISRLYRRGFHLFHKEKICHDYPEKKTEIKKEVLVPPGQSSYSGSMAKHVVV